MMTPSIYLITFWRIDKSVYIGVAAFLFLIWGEMITNHIFFSKKLLRKKVIKNIAEDWSYK